jgi:hypothetical protein
LATGSNRADDPIAGVLKARCRDDQDEGTAVEKPSIPALGVPSGAPAAHWRLDSIAKAPETSAADQNRSMLWLPSDVIVLQL